MEQEPMRVEQALAEWMLQEYRKPAISYQKLSLEIFKLYYNKKFNGKNIVGVKKIFPEKIEFNRNISKIIDSNIIENLIPFKENFFSIKAFSNFSIEDHLCSMYDIGYISYINAMSYYGITDRIPKNIHYTTLDRHSWKVNIYEFLKKTCPEIFNSSDDNYFHYFVEPYPSINSIKDRKIIIHGTKNYLHPKTTDSSIRVPDIGDLFLDIIKSPEHSGGMQHVLDVWREYGIKYHRRILNRVDLNGSNLDKARIGFLMEKVLKIKNDIIQKWKVDKGNVRGGSRKFLASENFSEIICYDWNISINCKDLIKYV